MVGNSGEMIYKLIFNIGTYFRNPSLNKWLNFLKESERWSLKELQAFQLKKLQEIVTIAYETTDFYHSKMDKIEIHPAEIVTFEDLKKLPIVTKKELLEMNAHIHSNYKFNKVFKANTSGTSGESLKFLKDENADSFNRAAVYRGYSWYAINPWERNGYCWGFKFSTFERLKTRLQDGFQNRFRNFGYSIRNITQFANKLKNANYLHGYSSMIYETAKLINKNKLQKPKHLKLVKGTSESIYKLYQEEIIKAFGTKMISEYGAAETGIIAFECKFGNMHLNMEGVIVEEIENEIIVTNLQMRSFPIIRYKLGDYIKLAEPTKKCKCGMNHLILDEVIGRVGNLIYGFGNTYPSLYFYYIFKNLDKTRNLALNYQVIQNEKGILTFLVTQFLSEKELKWVEDEIDSYFKNDINYEIKMSQEIYKSNGKFKSFISTINE